MRRTINFLVNLGDAEPARDCSVCFVVDLSGSMVGEPLSEVKPALARAVATLADLGRDRANEATLITFDSDIREICPWVGPAEFDFFTDCIAAVPDVVLAGGGKTRFYDAVWEALERTRVGARQDTDHLLLLFSDGGDWGSEDHSQADVLTKVRQCRHGFVEKSAREQSPLADLPAEALEKLFETAPDGSLIFRADPLDPRWPESVQLASDMSTWLRDRARESRRPVRVLTLHFGAGHETVMKELSEVSDGEYFHAARAEEIQDLFGRALDVVLRSERQNLRTRLMRRLQEGEPQGADWFRLITVNGGSWGWNAKTDTLSPSPNYHLEAADLNGPSGRPSRKQVLEAFRRGPGKALAEDLHRMLQVQARSPAFVGSKILADAQVLVAFRGRDILGTSLAGELISQLAKASEDQSLFGGVSSLIVVVLLEQWELYGPQDKHDLYALLLELCNLPAATGPSAILFLSESNEAGGNAGRGYAGLDDTQFGNLALEALVALNAEQYVANSLPTELAASSEPGGRFGALGVTSLFLDGERAAKSAAARELRQVLASLFEEPADPEAARKMLRLQPLIESFKARDLVGRLLGVTPGPDLVSRLDCPDISRLAFFEPAKPLRFPNREAGIGSWHEIIFKYRDQSDFLRKVFLDIEEYVSVCHSLDFFAVDLEKKATSLAASALASIRDEVDQTLRDPILGGSPWLARELLRELRAWLDNYLEKGQLDREFQEWRESLHADRIMLSLGRGLAAGFDKARCEEYRATLRKQIAFAPLPIALKTKYASLGGLLAVFGGAALAAGIRGLGFAALAAAVGTGLAGALKLWRSRKAIGDYLTLYHAAHQAQSRDRALELARTKLGELYEHLKAKIGAEDEPPQPGTADPFEPESHSERQMLAVLERHVVTNLPNAIPVDPPRADSKSWFRIDVGDQQVALPHSWIAGPLTDPKNAIAAPGSDLLPRYLALHRTCALHEFPSVLVRFVPDLASTSLEARSKLRIEERVREKQYRLTLLAKLEASERKELEAAHGSAEWRTAVERLDLLVSQHPQRLDHRLFDLWREVVQYELWLTRLGQLVERQDPSDKSFRLFDLWRRTYIARREFREGLFEEALQAARAGVQRHQRLFALLGREFAGEQQLWNHVVGFSFPAMPLEQVAQAIPRPWESIFTSRSNQELYTLSEVLGGGPKRAGWPSSPSETLGDFEARFVTFSPVAKGVSRTLASIAAGFLALPLERQEEHFLDESFLGAWRGHQEPRARPKQRGVSGVHVPFAEN